MTAKVSLRARICLAAACLAAVLAVASSVPDHSAAGTDPRDRLAVLAVLKAGQYDRLEGYLRRLHDGYEAGRRSETELEAAYAAFASADPALRAKLETWVARRPGSFAARLARAGYDRHLARIARRNGAPARVLGQSVDDVLARARRDLERAVGLHPRLGVGYAALIGIAMADGAGPQADRWFERGLAADPGSAALRRAYLLSLRPWRRPDEDPVALMERLRALAEASGETAGEARDPSPALAALAGFHDYVTAELLRRQRRHGQAELYYREALARGRDWLYLRGAGMNALQSAKPVAAVGFFSEALAGRPQTPVLLDWRAHALWSLGNRGAALADWRLALAVDPGNPDILYAFAQALRRQGEAELAAEVIEGAAGVARENARLRGLRGELLLADLDRPDDAIAELRSAVTLDPGAGESWRAYAEALYLANDCEGAADALVRYRQLCADGTRCSDDDLAWAGRTLEETRDPDICPVYGILGP